MLIKKILRALFMLVMIGTMVINNVYAGKTYHTSKRGIRYSVEETEHGPLVDIPSHYTCWIDFMEEVASHNSSYVRYNNIEYRYNKASKTLTITGISAAESMPVEFPMLSILRIGSADGYQRFETSIKKDRIHSEVSRERAKIQKKEDIEELGKAAFEVEQKFKKEIAGRKESIGNRYVEKMVFKGHLKVIGGNFFRSNMCSETLKEVDMSDSKIEVICGSSFIGCKNLRVVEISPNLRFIGKGSFGLSNHEHKLDTETVNELLRFYNKDSEYEQSCCNCVLF